MSAEKTYTIPSGLAYELRTQCECGQSNYWPMRRLTLRGSLKLGRWLEVNSRLPEHIQTWSEAVFSVDPYEPPTATLVGNESRNGQEVSLTLVAGDFEWWVAEE